MTAFEVARKDVLIELSKLETVEVLSEKEKNNTKWFKKFVEVWKFNKLIEVPGNNQKELTFFLCFGSDFPVSLPDVYLDAVSYQEVKYIPHVDSNYFICTFDRALTITNPEDPIGIVREVLKRARNIVEDGIAKRNVTDFVDEFLSYWENRYEKELDVNTEIISFISRDPKDLKVTLLSLDDRLRRIKHILFQENKAARNFKTFLDEHEIAYSENDVFYVDRDIVNNHPPYHIRCSETIETIKGLGNEFYNSFKRYINNNSELSLILFKKKINSKDHYLGWFYPAPKLNVNGWRRNGLNPLKVFSTKVLQGSKCVNRISPIEYTHERIVKRSSGIVNVENEKKFIVAGLGSVGSHLVYFINGFQGADFKLFDPELLTIENTGRHLLGLEHVSLNKALAMKEYLVWKNPKLKVEAFGTSVLHFCNSEPSTLNDSDFLFLAVGNYNVETHIVNLIRKGVIKIPTFIFWVEPYLAGGHCIFVDPYKVKYEEYYETTEGRHLFRYNIINNTEYLRGNELLIMKEASCQSTYVPYSGSDVIRFLSQVYPFILKNISNDISDNCGAISWVGDLNMLNDMGIKLSDFAQGNNSFNIIEHK